MNSYSKLKKNTIIFLCGTFGAKILSIILVPYYTNIMSTKEFGEAELLLTLANLLLPLLSCSITDAVLRFSMDNAYEKREILYWGTIFILVGNCVGMLLYPLLCIYVEKNLVLRFYTYMISTSVYGLFGAFTKGIGRTKIYALGGIIYAVIYSISNIILLGVMDLGICGYIDSSTIACIGVSIYYFIFSNIKKYYFIKYKRNYLLCRELLRYSIPLISNNISWWISNSSDKFLINYYINSEETGIYAIAYRIPNLINTIASVFISAWQLATVENLNQEGTSQFYNAVYKIFFRYMALITAFIICFCKLISKVLFLKDFYIAWKFIPALAIAAFFCNLSTFIGGILTAYKSTKIIFTSTMIGAIINIILNIIFIPFLGGVGAAWSTCVSYCITFVLRIIFLAKNMNVYLFKKKQCCIIIILIMQAILFPQLSYINILFLFLIVGIHMKSIMADLQGCIHRYQKE